MGILVVPERGKPYPYRVEEVEEVKYDIRAAAELALRKLPELISATELYGAACGANESQEVKTKHCEVRNGLFSEIYDTLYKALK